MEKQKVLTKKQRKFLGTCPICGQGLKKINGVNVLRCENTSCKGKKKFSHGEIFYEPYIRILNDRGVEIYDHLFK